MPFADSFALTAHLNEIATHVAPGAHAVLVLDGAGWHTGDKVDVPPNITLVILPPYSPELNGAENVWEYLRKNKLAHRLFENYDAIANACCQAWNDLIAMPERLTSITQRAWACMS
jgi:transposase